MTRNIRNKNVTIKCVVCGTQFHPIYGRRNSSVACSNECRAKYVGAKKTDPIEHAFNNRVDKTGDCWLWNGAVNEHGYGIFRRERAHRISYRLHVSEVNAADVVCHKCDNPRCVNPDHLFLGTQADNVADMDIKNRRKTVTMRGATHPRSKLTDEDVREIRSSNLSRTELEAKFGVSKALIARILRGEMWKHVL